VNILFIASVIENGVTKNHFFSLNNNKDYLIIKTGDYIDTQYIGYENGNFNTVVGRWVMQNYPNYNTIINKV
jgi:hypothetical protein